MVQRTFIGLRLILKLLKHFDRQNLKALQSFLTKVMPWPGYMLLEQKKHFSIRIYKKWQPASTLLFKPYTLDDLNNKTDQDNLEIFTDLRDYIYRLANETDDVPAFLEANPYIVPDVGKKEEVKE